MAQSKALLNQFPKHKNLYKNEYVHQFLQLYRLGPWI